MKETRKMNHKIEIEIEGMGKIKFENLRDSNKNEKNMPIKNSKYVKTIPYAELCKLLNNQYIVSLLKKRNKIRVFEAMPIHLVSQYRYDVFIKYFYVQTYITKKNYDLGKEIYLKHIKSFNHFIEPDGRKKGPQDFIKKFNILIDHIKDSGMDKTIIPITKNGEIIDGAHRLAIALYLNLKVKFAIFDLLDANYNKAFFINRGFDVKYAQIIDEEVLKNIR